MYPGKATKAAATKPPRLSLTPRELDTTGYLPQDSELVRYAERVARYLTNGIEWCKQDEGPPYFKELYDYLIQQSKMEHSEVLRRLDVVEKRLYDYDVQAAFDSIRFQELLCAYFNKQDEHIKSVDCAIFEFYPQAQDRQVGGSHYVQKAIQPWEVIERAGLDFFEGNVVKYLLRYKDKNGIEDLDKALHYLEKVKENYIERNREGSCKPCSGGCQSGLGGCPKVSGNSDNVDEPRSVGSPHGDPHDDGIPF